MGGSAPLSPLGFSFPTRTPANMIIRLNTLNAACAAHGVTSDRDRSSSKAKSSPRSGYATRSGDTHMHNREERRGDQRRRPEGPAPPQSTEQDAPEQRLLERRNNYPHSHQQHHLSQHGIRDEQQRQNGVVQRPLPHASLEHPVQPDGRQHYQPGRPYTDGDSAEGGTSPTRIRPEARGSPHPADRGDGRRTLGPSSRYAGGSPESGAIELAALLSRTPRNTHSTIASTASLVPQAETIERLAGAPARFRRRTSAAMTITSPHNTIAPLMIAVATSR